MRVYPLLLDLHNKLLINKTSVEFITSDHPIVMYNQLLTFRTFGSNCGVACKGLQIFYPLDPKKVLMLYDGQIYRVGSKRIAIDITNPQDEYRGACSVGGSRRTSFAIRIPEVARQSSYGFPGGPRGGATLHYPGC
jgi:hypothetical protein